MNIILIIVRVIALLLRYIAGGQILWPAIMLVLCIIYAEMLALCRAYVLGVVVHSSVGVYRGLLEFLGKYCVGLARLSVEWISGHVRWAYCRLRVWLSCARRRQRIRRDVSKRVGRILELLDFEDSDTVDELVGGRQYVRAAVLYSRQCRLALRYPKHSAANEMIVVDWLNKHLPENMPFSVKFKIIPLASKLTFVKSDREVRADEYFGLLGSLVETA